MSTALSDLVAGLPADAVLTDPAAVAAYRYDEAAFCAAGTPLVVVRPTDTAQVQHVLRTATAHRVPVVTQGARTGLSGAANAVDGAIVLSLLRMDRIVEIDPVDQVAAVEPGVVNAALSRAAAEHGLCYPPDPASWESSTLGGNLATNAGGLACVKYGVTGDFVRGLEVVCADGELLRTGRRPAKGVAGYDLTRLIVGSEGTLGVITQATLSLRPAPAPALTVAAAFDSARAALAAVTDVMAAGLTPSLAEFLDGPTVAAIQDHRDLGLPSGVGALVLLQSDRGTAATADVAAMGRICVAHGALDVAVASDDTESAMLMQARRLVHAGLERLGATLIDDVAVPRGRLIDLLDGVDAIAARRDVRIVCPGHVGDGNMHPTVVFDRGDDAAAERALAAFGDVMELGLALGGTITGEHGVGLLKREWLARELGPTSLRLQAGIRAVFDPWGLLNPGKLWVPEVEQQPI